MHGDGEENRPYHYPSPAGAVEGVWRHFLLPVVSDEERRVMGFGYIQQEVQHRVWRRSIGAWTRERGIKSVTILTSECTWDAMKITCVYLGKLEKYPHLALLPQDWWRAPGWLRWECTLIRCCQNEGWPPTLRSTGSERERERVSEKHSQHTKASRNGKNVDHFF